MGLRCSITEREKNRWRATGVIYSDRALLCRWRVRSTSIVLHYVIIRKFFRPFARSAVSRGDWTDFPAAVSSLGLHGSSCRIISWWLRSYRWRCAAWRFIEPMRLRKHQLPPLGSASSCRGVS